MVKLADATGLSPVEINLVLVRILSLPFDLLTLRNWQTRQAQTLLIFRAGSNPAVSMSVIKF